MRREKQEEDTKRGLTVISRSSGEPVDHLSLKPSCGSDLHYVQDVSVRPSV